MKLLILTDHLTHTSTNSFYLIASRLVAHLSIDSVTLASRSLRENDAFFSGRRCRLRVKHMTGTIKYETFRTWILEDNVTIDDLSLFDFILLRLPRPIHPDFFSFLGQCFNERHIVNRPSGILETGSKAFLLQVSDFTPPLRLLKSVDDIVGFKKNFPIVLKPLENYGGKGIVRIDGDKVYLGNKEVVSFAEYMCGLQDGSIEFIGMKFLKNVKNGDKRIVVADGEVLASSLRFPAEGSWLCNVAQGGHAELSKVTKEEAAIIEHINPILRSKGIFMYGLDTLEDDEGVRVISEINTLSVGGIAPAEELSDHDIGSRYANLFVNFVSGIE